MASNDPLGLGNDLGAVSNVIGGYVPGASQGGAQAVFVRGEKLGTTDGDIGGAHPPDDLATHDTGAPIEFIHFGFVHPDDSKPFEHTTSLDDYQSVELGQGPNSRAIMFRAALEREALLLGGFIQESQMVLIEKESSLGGLGEALSAVTDLIGGSGGSSAPKAADLNELGKKVVAAAGSIKESNITYSNIHKAGIDLNQVRADYRAFLSRLKEYLAGEAKPKDGLLNNISGLAGSLGGVGPIFDVISGIATKAFDIYVGFYTGIALGLEPAIEKACHDISINAIENNAKVIFPIWGPIPEASSAPAPSSLPGPLGDAVDTVNSGIQDVKDFFEDTGPVECRGSNYLPQAFSITDPAPRDQPPPLPKDLGKIIGDAFKDQIKDIPNEVIDIIKGIEEVILDFVKAVYQKAMERDPNGEIDAASIYAAGRRQMLDRLVNLVISQASILDTIKNASVGLGDINISAGKLMNKGLDELNEQILSKLDPIFNFTMKHFAATLEGVRHIGVDRKSHTMELYLGRLPYLLALLFRDTFFPIWDLIVGYVFGSIGGPIGQFMDSFSAFRSDAQDYFDKGRDIYTKADKVVDTYQREGGVSAGSDGGNIGEYMEDLNATADRTPHPDEDSIFLFFPLTGRELTGTGQPIHNQEWNTVNQNHKWETAKPA